MIPVLTLATKVKLIVTAVGAFVFLGSCMLRDEGLKQQGADARDKQIVKANQHAVDKGSSAAHRSRDPGVQGVRDPSTRD